MSFTVCHTHNEPQIVIHCEGDNIKMYCKQCFLPHIATKTGVILNEKSKNSLVEWNQFLLFKFKEIQANIKIKGINALYEMKLNASYPRGLISQLNNQEMGYASIEIIDKYLNTLATNVQFISTRQTIEELCIPELLKDIYVFFVSETNKSLGFLAERIQALLRDQLADKKIYEFVQFIFAPKEIRVLELKRKIIVKNVEAECLLKKQEILTPTKNSSTPTQLSPVAQVKILTPTRISQQSPTISRNLEENVRVLGENKLVPSQVNTGSMSMSTSQVSRTISDNGTIISEETIINQLTPKKVESDFVRQRIEVQQRVPSVDQDISIQNIAVPNLIITQRQSTQSNLILNRNITQTSSVLTPRQSTGQNSMSTPRQSTEASSRIISRQSTEVSSRLTPTRLNTEPSSGIVTRQISSGLVGSPQTIIQRQSSQLTPQLVQGSVLTQSPISNAQERQGQNIINIQPSATKYPTQSIVVQSNPVISNLQKLSTQSTATIEPQSQSQPQPQQMQMPSQVSTQVPSQNDFQAHSQVSIQILPQVQQVPQNSPPQLSPQKVPSQQVPPHPKPITQSEQYKSLHQSLQQKELQVQALQKEKLELQHSNAQLSSTILKQEKTIKTQELSIRTLNNLISNQQQQIHYRQNQVQILTQQIHKLILYKTQSQQLSNKLSIAQKQLAFKDKSISCLNNLIGNQEEEILTRENQVEVLNEEIRKLVQWKNRYHQIEQQIKDKERMLHQKERMLHQKERGIKELNNVIGNEEEELAFREGQVQMLTSELNKAKQHANTLESTITSQQSEIQSLQSTIGSQKQQIQSLQSTIAFLQPKITTQQSQIQSLQSKICSQQSQIQSLQPTIGCLQSQIKSLQPTIGCLQSTISSQQQKITCQESEIQSLQATICSEQSELQSLESQLSQYKSALQIHQHTQKDTQKQIHMLKSILKQKQYSDHHHHDLDGQGASFDQQLMEQVIQLESDVVARNMEIYRLVGVVNRLRGVIKEGVNQDVEGWLTGFKIARFQK